MAKPKELEKLTPAEQKKLINKLIAKQGKKQGTGGRS